VVNIETKIIKNSDIQPEVSVVMTVAGDRETTWRALESIDKYSIEEFELILVDGEQHLEEFKFKNPLIRPIKIINIGERVGYVKAMNIGLKEAKGNYIVICQNDIELDYWELDWIVMMRRLLDTHPNYGAVGPTTSTRHSRLWFNGKFIEPDDFMFGFQCVMIRKKALEDIGYIDENFIGNGGFDDDDFFLRMKLKNWVLGVAFFGVKHHYEKGFARSVDLQKAQENAQRNYDYFNQKWEKSGFKRGDKIVDNNTASARRIGGDEKNN